MAPSTYYSTQSPITDPGENVELFGDLPDDIADLCRIVQGLYVHFHGLEHYGISGERLPEINTRYVEKMLARIVELDGRPLTEPRSPDKRLVGCCRDADVLFCAMARHQGIPTRIRVGFATYLNDSTPDFNVSHTVVEYWDLCEQRWRLVDVDQCWRVVGLDGFVPGEHDVGFDLYDVPRDQFLVAGKAWQMCRTGEADPNRFGLFENLKGLSFIRGNLILDLAAQNKMELLLWDFWGWLLRDIETYTEEEWQLLDKVAVLTQASNEAFAEMRATYEEKIGLKVPRVVKCYSPVGEPSEVTLPATAA